MNGKDYYKILGVNKNATKDEIKQAYRKLAMQYHPDRATSDKKKEYEEKFKEISEAYAVLINDEKRAQYDMFGSVGAGVTQEDIFRGADFSDFQDIFDIDEIFRWFFGEGIGKRRSRYEAGRDIGEDLECNLSISLKEASLGTEKEVRFFHDVKCETCNGTGSKGGSRTVCDKCHGKGIIQTHRRTGFITFTSTHTCPKCYGQGTIIQNPCNVCHGTGKIKKEARIKVRIPSGADTGDTLRVAGQGNYGKDRQGDLYVRINVIEDNFFKRKGEDIYCTVKIPFTLAVLGGKINVQTLQGNAVLNIPEGTQPGTILRMKGMGIRNEMKGYVGDQFVIIEVEIPKTINERQRKLLIALDEEMRKSKDKFWFW